MPFNYASVLLLKSRTEIENARTLQKFRSLIRRNVEQKNMVDASKSPRQTAWTTIDIINKSNQDIKGNKIMSTNQKQSKDKATSLMQKKRCFKKPYREWKDDRSYYPWWIKQQTNICLYTELSKKTSERFMWNNGRGFKNLWGLNKKEKTMK